MAEQNNDKLRQQDNEALIGEENTQELPQENSADTAQSADALSEQAAETEQTDQQAEAIDGNSAEPSEDEQAESSEDESSEDKKEKSHKKDKYSRPRPVLLTELYPDFVAPDVSMPQDPRREIEIIEEEVARARRSWLKKHMTFFYVLIGILAVVLIFFGIRWFNDRINPMSQFVSSLSRDFNSSFDFDVAVEKDGISVMRYDGTFASNPGTQSVQIVYDAEYTNYSFRNVIYTDKAKSYKGNYYNGQWTIGDCTDRVQDFFDFHSDFSRGHFDGGSFLRFTELTSKYSAKELEQFVKTLRDRLGTNSAVSQVTTKGVDGATVYTFDVSFDGLFTLLREDGAAIFFRSTDYDNFCARYDANKEIIQDAELTMSFAVTGGNMSEISLVLDVGGEEYAVYCTMSNFGKAEPAIPEDFFEAAAIKAPQQ